MNLSLPQRVRRRLSLFFASSYTHPDGTIEFDIDEKAGIDPTADDEDTQKRKFQVWNQREAAKQEWWKTFSFGALAGGTLVYWWLR